MVLLKLPTGLGGMDNLALRLRHLKAKVKNWTKERSWLMKLESSGIEEKICEILAAYPSGILSMEDTSLLKSLKVRKKIILAHEMLTWQLKSIFK